MPHEFKVIHVPEREAKGLPSYTFTVNGVPSLHWFGVCHVEGLPPTYYVDRCINALKAGLSTEAFGPMPQVKVGDTVVELKAPSADMEERVRAALVKGGMSIEDAEKRIVANRAMHEKKGRGKVEQVPGKPEVEMVTVHGGATKPREKRPRYRYVLDGKESTETFPTEAAAKAACAVAAFMSGGKLGAIPLAQAMLEATYPGKDCKVFACPTDHCIKATVDGKEVGIVWVRGADGTWGVEKFKERVTE